MGTAATGVESTRERLGKLLDEFVKETRDCEPELEELFFEDPRGFQRAVFEYLRNPGQEPAEAAVLHLLDKTGLLLKLLLDRERVGLEEAIWLAQLAQRNHLPLDVRLAGAVQQSPSRQHTDRVLGVLAEIAQSNRILPMLLPLLRIKDRRIRSKTAKIFAKVCPSCGFVKESLEDPDARVRANTIEAFGGHAALRGVLLGALEDSDNRVRANAAVGLHRLGSPVGIEALAKMARHPEYLFRASAAWGMGEAGEQGPLAILDSLSKDPNEQVRRNALEAIAKIEGR